MSLTPCSNGMRNQLFTCLFDRAEERGHESEAFDALDAADSALHDALGAYRQSLKALDAVRNEEVRLREAIRVTHREFCFVWAIRRVPNTGKFRQFLTVPAHLNDCGDAELFATLLPYLGKALGSKELRPVERLIANQLFVEINHLRRIPEHLKPAQEKVDKARTAADLAAATWDRCFTIFSNRVDLETFFLPNSYGEHALDCFMKSRRPRVQLTTMTRAFLRAA